MSSPLISVIVPIYNMESLLPRCLDSLAAQTLRDLEIICVDDGSTDGSGGIVRKYASGDSRFRLITQENSGRAEARNAGIRAAAAPYLGFADPDDYVEPDMYERLYRLAEETGADMVQCSYSPFLPAESEESRGMAEEKLLHVENTACDGVFTEKGEIFRLFLEDRITGVVWSKLFRRLLPGCSAPLEVRLPSSFTSGEDTLYVSRAIARCRSVALTSEKLYHYGLGGPQSVSSRNRKAETRPASYYAIFEMLTREKLREGVLGSNRTAYMNYIFFRTMKCRPGGSGIGRNSGGRRASLPNTFAGFPGNSGLTLRPPWPDSGFTCASFNVSGSSKPPGGTCSG